MACIIQRDLECKILADKHAGNIVFISQIPLSPSSIANLPFDIWRTQFPLQLAFAMTINKVKPWDMLDCALQNWCLHMANYMQQFLELRIVQTCG